AVRAEAGGGRGVRRSRVRGYRPRDEIKMICERAAVDALEPAVEQDEVVCEPPLHRARRAVVEPHGDAAARPLRDPLAHRDAVLACAVLPLHVIEAVDGIVGLVEW